MKTVGITGGMGSGKSTVARIFQHLGIPVYTSDERAKALYVTSAELKAFIINLVGPTAYVDGQFIPSVLSKHLAQNPQDWELVNTTVHPLVGKDYAQWVEEHSRGEAHPYLLKETALLFELGLEKSCDSTVLVTAPEDIRIQRVMDRSGLSMEEIQGRMKKQWPDDKKKPLADYIIDNSGQHSLIKQVLSIHEDLSGRPS